MAWREVREASWVKGAGGRLRREGGATTGGMVPTPGRTTDRLADDVALCDVTTGDVTAFDVIRRDVTECDVMAGLRRGKGGGGGRTVGARPTMTAVAMVVGAAESAGTEEEVRAEKREDTAVRGQSAGRPQRP